MTEIREHIADALGADYELNVNYQAIACLERQVRSDPTLAAEVSEAFARRAVQLERRLTYVEANLELSCKIACGSLAALAVRLALKTEDRLRLIESLGARGAATVMRTLSLQFSDLAVLAHGSDVFQQDREAAGRALLEAASRGSSRATEAVEDEALRAEPVAPRIWFARAI